MVFKKIQDIFNLDGVVVWGSHGAWSFPNSIRGLFKILDKQFVQRDQHFFHTSLFIHSHLTRISFDRNWIVVEKDPVLYRRVPVSGPGSDPLSITGSFGCGGRFNIGTAQADKEAKKKMPGLVYPQPAHYTSQDRNTARKEYGDFQIPGSSAVTYELSLKARKQLRFIDADLAVKDLLFYISPLSEIVQSGRIDSTYCDVKKVIPTQLFAHWLWHECPMDRVDGIRFKSQADPEKYNYCLYLSSDAACKKLLKSKKIHS